MITDLHIFLAGFHVDVGKSHARTSSCPRLEGKDSYHNCVGSNLLACQTAQEKNFPERLGRTLGDARSGEIPLDATSTGRSLFWPSEARALVRRQAGLDSEEAGGLTSVLPWYLTSWRGH